MAKVDMPSSSLNLPSNSQTTIPEMEPVEQERPKVKKVIKGKVVTKKKSIGRKFADTFIGEDVQDVKGYILQDVLVPAIKDTISDVVTGGIEMLLFGERRGRGGRSYSTNSRTSYNSMYNRSTQSSARRHTDRRGYSSHAVNDIILESRGEAEQVLGDMLDAIKDYGSVSVADLYDMVGETGVFTDNNWGWFDLGNASVRRVREGYLLVLPRVESLK